MHLDCTSSYGPAIERVDFSTPYGDVSGPLPEVLARVFVNLNELDLQNAASVSSHWRTIAVETTKHQEIVKILGFIDFLRRFLQLDESKSYNKQIIKLNELKEEIRNCAGNIEKGITTLVKSNHFNVKIRDRIIDILITVPDRILELLRDDLFPQIPKPRFFDIILSITFLRKAHPSARILKEDKERVDQDLASFVITPLQREQLEAAIEQARAEMRVSLEGYYEGFGAEKAICGKRNTKLITDLFASSENEQTIDPRSQQARDEDRNWYWYSENGMSVIPRDEQVPVEDESRYITIAEMEGIDKDFYFALYYRRPQILRSLSELIELGYIKTAIKIGSVFPSSIGAVSFITTQLLDKFGLEIEIAKLSLFTDQVQRSSSLATIIRHTLLKQSKFEKAFLLASRMSDDYQPEKSIVIVDIIKAVLEDFSNQTSEDMYEKITLIGEALAQSKLDHFRSYTAWGHFNLARVIYSLKHHELKQAIKFAEESPCLINRPIAFSKIQQYQSKIKRAVEVDEKDPNLLDTFQQLTTQVIAQLPEQFFAQVAAHPEQFFEQVLAQFPDNPLAAHALPAQGFETEDEAAPLESTTSRVKPKKEGLIGQSTVRVEELIDLAPESGKEEKLEDTEEFEQMQETEPAQEAKPTKEPKPERGTRRWEKSAADSDSDDELPWKRRRFDES